MLKLLFHGLIRVAVVWSLAIYYSVLVCLSIAKDWLLRFDQKPWQSKKRDEPPECLKDPKYGVHKYVRVNVSSVDFRLIFHFVVGLSSAWPFGWDLRIPNANLHSIFCYVRRKYVCITLRMAIQINRWCCSFTDFQSSGIHGVTKLRNFLKTIGMICVFALINIPTPTPYVTCLQDGRFRYTWLRWLGQTEGPEQLHSCKNLCWHQSRYRTLKYARSFWSISSATSLSNTVSSTFRQIVNNAF